MTESGFSDERVIPGAEGGLSVAWPRLAGALVLAAALALATKAGVDPNEDRFWAFLGPVLPENSIRRDLNLR